MLKPRGCRCLLDICPMTKCRPIVSRRMASAAATAVAPPDELSPVQTSYGPHGEDPAISPACKVRAGVVLSRAPLLTRDLTPFEKSFHYYQRRLNERLVLPFTRYFYYQQNTPADLDWKRKMKKRSTPAREMDGYNPFGAEAWNDELLVNSTAQEPDIQVETLLAEEVVTKEAVPGLGQDQELMLAEQSEPRERPLPRRTKADEENDRRSLNRALERTLYFLVKDPSGTWHFPTANLNDRESLNRGATRVLTSSGGVNMNFWVVGNAPVGHMVRDISEAVGTSHSGNSSLEKTFFMRARIMAGKAVLAGNQHGWQDHQWLTKEEIEPIVDERYWRSIRSMLVRL